MHSLINFYEIYITDSNYYYNKTSKGTTIKNCILKNMYVNNFL